MEQVINLIQQGEDARAVEQVLIEKYGMIKDGGTLLNKINSISKENSIYEQAIQKGSEILKSIGESLSKLAQSVEEDLPEIEEDIISVL